MSLGVSEAYRGGRRSKGSHGSECFFTFPFLKKLDQGHLHPKLDVPRLTCPGREFKGRWKRETMGARKEANVS